MAVSQTKNILIFSLNGGITGVKPTPISPSKSPTSAASGRTWEAQTPLLFLCFIINRPIRSYILNFETIMNLNFENMAKNRKSANFIHFARPPGMSSYVGPREEKSASLGLAASLLYCAFVQYIVLYPSPGSRGIQG